MVSRVLGTSLLAAWGLYAFWTDAVGGGHFLNPFGILFLLLAAGFWFGWGPMRDGFRSASKDQTDTVSSVVFGGLEQLGRRVRPPPS